MILTEWAQCFSKEMLPIPLNGPTLPTNASDTLAWAHYCCQIMLLMITNGLITAVELTVTNGPTVVSKKSCRYACMGPFLLPENMLMIMNWPILYAEKYW